MRAAFIFGEGMEFVHHHEPARSQRAVVARLRKQDGERLRRGQEDVRRALANLGAFLRGGVAGAQGDADVFLQPHLDQRAGEVFLDVVRQRAQR